MDLSIVLDTAGAKVGDLGTELRTLLVDEINAKYDSNSLSIGVAIRCLPESYGRKSFVRYAKADNYLTIDFCVSLEEYTKLYKIEQKFELGKVFLEWLEKGKANKNFQKYNPDFDYDSFINTIIELGKESGWFADEVDYSQELEF